MILYKERKQRECRVDLPIYTECYNRYIITLKFFVQLIAFKLYKTLKQIIW